VAPDRQPDRLHPGRRDAGGPGYDRLQEAFGIGATGSLVPGEPRFNPDQWDGYQDDQREVITAMAASPADPVVLTGDIHSSWANDIPQRFGEYVPAEPANNSIGVEFVCPSITSDGFTEVLGGEPQARAATTAFQGVNPWIRYLDGIGHGFAVIDVTPDRVQTDFWHLTNAAGTIAAAAREDPGAGIALAAAFQSVKGSRSSPAQARWRAARRRARRSPAAAPPAAGAAPAAGRPSGGARGGPPTASRRPVGRRRAAAAVLGRAAVAPPAAASDQEATWTVAGCARCCRPRAGRPGRAGPAAAARQAADKTRVYVIVVDGLNVEEVALMPFLSSLAANGTFYQEAGR
jgi:hypothetical protein